MRRYSPLLAAAALAAMILPWAGAAAPATAADAICVGTDGYGVSCVREGRWETYSKASGALASDTVYAMTACHGRLLVAAGNAVHAFDGTDWSGPNALPDGLARGLSCAPDGGYWVAAGTRIYRWTGESWDTVDTGRILGDQRPKYVNDLAAAPGGSAWIVTAGRIAARYDAGGWTVYRDGHGLEERLYLSRVHVGRDGAVWLPHPAGLTRYLGGAWTTFAGPGAANAVAEGPDRAIWLVSNGHLTRFRGGTWRRWTLSHRGNDVAVGDDGRVWIATWFGLGLLDNGNWSWRNMHDSGLAANRLTAAAVLGRGSELPGVALRDPGMLTGRFEWANGRPLAGARVEICASPPALVVAARDGPCDGKPLLRGATTNGDGRFAISGLRPATYWVTVRPKDSPRWMVSFDSRRTRVEPGQVRDAGTWRINASTPPG